MREDQIMKHTFVTSCLVIGTLLIPVAACADEVNSDIKQSETFVRDSIITTKVKAKLFDHKMSSLTNVKVDTDAKGAVYLSGTVASAHDADVVVSTARGTEGVTSVTSTLRINHIE
jgi:hyperosmotically inducible protein